MKLYPVCLKLEQKKCLVVGGGVIACRKVKSLLECNATVIVVSPTLCKPLERLRRNRRFQYKKEEYKKIFLKDVFLVVAATDKMEINEQVAKDAQRKKILLNVVDVPQLCDFYVPAVARKDPLLLAISTQGEFPGLAKVLRKELQPWISKRANKVKVLAKLRNQIKQKVDDKKIRAGLIKKLMTEE